MMTTACHTGPAATERTGRPGRGTFGHSETAA